MDLNTLQPYLDMLPLGIIVFISAFLLTPIIGILAEKFNFVDLPATMRSRTDKTLAQRLHDEVKPRAGAVAVLIPLLIVILFSVQLTPQIIGLILGGTILAVIGVLDDKYEISGGIQFAIQFIASLIVVVSGTSILGISLAGINLDFNLFSTPLVIGEFVYNFVFPADLITILWIMVMINAFNWACGIDSLGEGIAIIASLTMTILAVRFGVMDLALISFLLFFGVMGFLPYNYPPSKIIGGSSGHVFGFILASLAVMISDHGGTGNGPKLTTAIIVLSIPLVDMVWVLINRMYEHKTINIFKLFSVSGRVHLHHRLMNAGLTSKQTLFLEVTAMAIISLIALYFGDFNTGLIAVTGVITSILVIFSFISIRNRKKSSLAKKSSQDDDSDDPPAIIDTGPTPEEKYAY